MRSMRFRNHYSEKEMISPAITLWKRIDCDGSALQYVRNWRLVSSRAKLSSEEARKQEPMPRTQWIHKVVVPDRLGDDISKRQGHRLLIFRSTPPMRLLCRSLARPRYSLRGGGRTYFIPHLRSSDFLKPPRVIENPKDQLALVGYFLLVGGLRM